MNFDLPAGIQELVATTRAFREERLDPLEAQFLRDGNVPWELRPKLQAEARERGLWALDVPEEHGGRGLGQLAVCAVHEELNKHPMMFEVGGAPEPALYHCAPHQWDKYFASVVRGERRSAYAFTEPGAGSDLGGIATTAVRDGEDWVIDGGKIFIGLAERVEFLILFASTAPELGTRGVSAFLVDSGTPGYEVVRTIPTMGDAWDPCELRFEDCRLPADALLGELNHGFAGADRQLGHGRLKIASYQLGIAQRCLDLAVAYAQERTTWGQPIASRQGVSFMLADSAVELDAARLLVYRTAWQADEGRDVRIEAFKAKLYATEMAQRVTDRCLQVFGGRGYAKDSPVQSFFRQVRLWRIGHGTAEIHRWMIARDLLGPSAAEGSR
ncbi:MAG: acyl-CoA dehydrogenase protein [Solirubrobacterales bacterium]|jgi:acyl-CoA dehydrogenase|nr:acyl-CoA dehydrogenase protein [Solirubrobacterales bacterium]